MIKVGIVDDQKLWLNGLKMILSAVGGLDVIWTAENGEVAIFMAKQTPPDVLLMDIRMPVMDGVAATKAILKANPAIKVLILTTFDEEAYIYETLKYGACGYLLKESEPEVIVKAIENVHMGGAVVDRSVAQRVFQNIGPVAGTHLNCLSEREQTVARAVADGLNNREIAALCHVSEGTVKNHLTHILEKLSLRDRTQLAIWVLKGVYERKG